MINYVSEEDVREAYDYLGKNDRVLCKIDGQLTLVQGSPLAFDDQLEGYVTNIIASHYGNWEKAMEVAKEITAGFYDEFGIREVYISEEY